MRCRTSPARVDAALSLALADDAIPGLDRSRTQNWRLAGREPLRWRCWAGDYVVFDPFSGQTHMLDIVTGQVLRLLESGPSDIDRIRSEISAFLEVDDDRRVAEAVSDILARLEEAGLISPIR